MTSGGAAQLHSVMGPRLVVKIRLLVVPFGVALRTVANFSPGRRSARGRVCSGRATGAGRLPFNGGSFFVVVPSLNHKKGKRAGTVVVLPEDAHSFIQRFPALPLDMTIESPFRGRIVEAWPGAAYGNLIGMFVLHGAVKILEILLSPIASVGRPSSRTRLHPGVGSRKIIGELRCRLIFVDQQWRSFPAIAVFTNTGPVNVAALGTDKYYS